MEQSRFPTRSLRTRPTVLLVALLLAACASSSSTASARASRAAKPAADSTTTGGSPVVVTAYQMTRMLPGLVQIRSYQIPTPTGGVAQIKWFSKSGNGPALTSNLTTGHGVGITAIGMATSVADENLKETAQSGASPPDLQKVVVNGRAGIAYSDPLGWRSVLWVVDDNTVMSVTGLRLDDATLLPVAEGVTFH